MSSQVILESLTNKELREKCIEHGLPNVPITDTSRKLLIRRLQKAIDGDGKSTEKPKGRRETIHVTKITKTEEISTNSPKKTKPINNRRTTYETTTTTEPEPVVREIPIQVESVTQRRRSGRTTPISQLEHVINTSFKRKSDAIDEDSENEIIILDETRSSEVVPRQKRSPSLSKSITVTTSYVKAPVIDIEEEVEEDDIDENDSDVQEINEDVEEHFIPLTRPGISPYKTYETSREIPSSIQRTRPLFTETRPFLSSTPTSKFSTNFESSSATRRYTASGYNKPLTDTSSATTYLQHNSINNGRNDDDDDDDDDNNEQIETPYLSDFARRLSRLKAEPIIKHGGTHHEDSTQNREVPRRYYSTQIGGRRSYSQKDSIADSFRQF